MQHYTIDTEPWADEPAYNTLSRRLFPWAGLEEQAWGGSWVKIRPGETSTAHSHDEKEMFFIVSGTGVFEHDGEQIEARPGMTALMTPGAHHSLTNSSETEDLVFLAIWWTDDQQVAVEPASAG